MTTAQEALERLQAGNRRFAAGTRSPDARIDAARRNELLNGQAPFAVVLGCSDSRVPAEIVFDQGLGDLFVIRVAGNIATASERGSVEFGVGSLGARLVVVLGHTQCGAVQAALADMQQPTEGLPRDLRMIVDRVRQTVESASVPGTPLDAAALEHHAIRANVANTARQLRDTLAAQLGSEEILVVGAVYSLKTGRVDFFDGVPQS